MTEGGQGAEAGACVLRRRGGWGVEGKPNFQGRGKGLEGTGMRMPTRRREMWTKGESAWWVWRLGRGCGLARTWRLMADEARASDESERVIKRRRPQMKRRGRGWKKRRER